MVCRSRSAGQPQSWAPRTKNVGVPQRFGKAYVFVRNGNGWSLQQKLTAFSLDPVDLRYVHAFGTSVGISGNTVIVGSLVTATVGNSGQQGVAYTFDRNGTVWTPKQKLMADDGAEMDSFGESVAISGDIAIVGSGDTSTQKGAAYVFVRPKTTWMKEARLLASDGAVLDHFGFSVAVNGQTCLIGAFLAGNTQTEEKGAAYVFGRSGTSWSEQQKLMAPSQGGGFFGYSVGLSGDTAVVGAPDYRGALSGQGAAYIFTRSGAGWSVTPQQLIPNDAAAQDAFGTKVAVSGNTAVISAHLKDIDGKENQGKAYIYQKNGAMWVPGQQLQSTDGAAFQSFSLGLAISGDTIISGAPGDSSAKGAAYIYQTLDSDGDGIPDRWERYGITVNAAGNVVGTGNLVDQGTFINLPAMGAKPMHKDVFVHADWMGMDSTRPNVVIKPNARTMSLVRDAFQRAPVTNPDGRNGISLHVDLGPESIMYPGHTWGPLSKAKVEVFSGDTRHNRFK